MDLGPIVRAGPAEELALAVGADGDGEGGSCHLLVQSKRFGPVEFLRAVAGEAVRRAAENAREHRDRRGIGTEVSVEVLDVFRLEKTVQRAGFGEVDEVAPSAAVGSSADFERKLQPAEKRPRA